MRGPAVPRVGVAAHVLSADLRQVLLIRRGTPPSQGLWSVPGGKLELGESVHSAAVREVREETGVRCAVWLPSAPASAVTESVTLDDEGNVEWHYVLAHVPCKLEQSGTLPEPVAADDASAAEWVLVDSLHARDDLVKDLAYAVTECVRAVERC